MSSLREVCEMNRAKIHLKGKMLIHNQMIPNDKFYKGSVTYFLGFLFLPRKYPIFFGTKTDEIRKFGAVKNWTTCQSTI